MTQGFDLGVVLRNLPWLWSGMQLTLLLTAFAIAGGVLLGAVLAVARLSPFKLLVMFAAFYVNLFRSVPIVLAVFWFYFMVPIFVGHPIGAFQSILVAFVFFEAAY